MVTNELAIKVKECAVLFYQNREKEAYQYLNRILPDINQVLQNLLQISAEYEVVVATIMRQFLDAFQQKDQIALADLLEYAISEVMIEE